MSKIICRNEDGYGNITFVEYEVIDPIQENDEDITIEEVVEILEGVL